jgi:hypothetical protein
VIVIRDFDESARLRHAENSDRFGEHPFVFRGEQFSVRANVDYDVLYSVAALTEQTDGSKVISTVENAVISLIDPENDAHERFRKVRHEHELPVTFEDLMELLNWLIEEQTQRPPTPVDSSSGGSSANGTVLTEISSEKLAGV